MKAEDLTLYRVRIPRKSCPLSDIPAKVKSEFGKLQDRIHPGMRVAIACGSRGVNNIALIARSLAECLKAHGAEPFVIPAMGSHGGGTAEGQAKVLADYGITEEYVGAPILSSMEVVSLGHTPEPPHVPVYMDRNAYEADGVIVINRVKAHTDFHGEHESGIVKMLTIGLGKRAQATAIHSYGVRGLREYIPYVSAAVIRSGKIIGALAVLEDGNDDTADIAAARAEEIFDVDSAFLARSKSLMATLPFRDLDLLLVDAMGKDISGTGLDTNVIGRMSIEGQPDGEPHCRCICVLSLTPGSHGNAVGVGLADIISRRLRDEMDLDATYTNVVTSGFLKRGAIPYTAPSDRDAVETALKFCCAEDPDHPRFVRIPDTLHLGEIVVSESLLSELPSDCEILGKTVLSFDSKGQITAFQSR